MKKMKTFAKLCLATALFGVFADIGNAAVLTDVVEVQKYNRAIHIMAMLLVGFGFFNGFC